MLKQYKNKFDRKSILINIIISISVALSLSREQGEQLYELFRKVFDVIPSLPY